MVDLPVCVWCIHCAFLPAICFGVAKRHTSCLGFCSCAGILPVSKEKETPVSMQKQPVEDEEPAVTIHSSEQDERETQ